MRDRTIDYEKIGRVGVELLEAIAERRWAEGDGGDLNRTFERLLAEIPAGLRARLDAQVRALWRSATPEEQRAGDVLAARGKRARAIADSLADAHSWDEHGRCRRCLRSITMAPLRPCLASLAEETHHRAMENTPQATVSPEDFDRLKARARELVAVETAKPRPERAAFIVQTLGPLSHVLVGWLEIEADALEKESDRAHEADAHAMGSSLRHDVGTVRRLSSALQDAIVAEAMPEPAEDAASGG